MGLFENLFGKRNVRQHVEASPSTSRPHTERQVQYAKSLGVTIEPSMSYEDASRLISAAKLNQPPYQNQVDLCNRVGLKLLPKMTRAQVEELIDNARKDPTYIPKFAEIERVQQVEIEREEREAYGDEVVDLYKKWEAITDSGGQHILVFRKGEEIAVDVVEFDPLEIAATKKPYVKLNILRPRVKKDRDTGQFLEWDKEVAVNAQAVLYVQKLSPEIDMFDVPKYLKAVESGITFAKRFET